MSETYLAALMLGGRVGDRKATAADFREVSEWLWDRAIEARAWDDTNQLALVDAARNGLALAQANHCPPPY
jgi:hypothetical protein